MAILLLPSGFSSVLLYIKNGKAISLENEKNNIIQLSTNITEIIHSKSIVPIKSPWEIHREEG